ncbi:cleavage stimulating factor 64 [Perilla frutescens var. frutescens]|nr:cleavage stimulating factor 64 [Perilla frutescens var. frutescens]
MHQKVVFEILPVYCKGCRHVGHVIDDCYTMNGIVRPDRPVSASRHPAKPPPPKKQNREDPPPTKDSPTPRHVSSEQDKGKVVASSIPSSSNSHLSKKRKIHLILEHPHIMLSLHLASRFNRPHKVVEDMIGALEEDNMDYSSVRDSSAHERASPHPSHSSVPRHEKGEFIPDKIDHPRPSSFNPGPRSRSGVSGAPPSPSC